MDVVQLTTSHNTFDSRIFHKISRGLEEAGHNVTLVTPHHEQVTHKGVTIHPIGGEDVTSASLSNARELHRVARERDADVYHFHDPGFLPWAVRLSGQTDAKVIYDCHENYAIAFRYYDFPPNILNPIVGLYPTIQSVLCRFLDGVVTTTEVIADGFRQRGHANVQTVRNFPRVPETIRPSPRTPTHDFTLGYIGGIGPERGRDEMLKLLAKLRSRGLDVGLWLLGANGDHRREMSDGLQRLNVEANVKFLGRIRHEDIYPYLAATDIGLALLDPGRFQQSLPIKIFEYMTAGIPVVTTPIDVRDTYVTDRIGVTAPFQNVDRQADIVEEILQDPDRRDRMGKRAQKTVKTRYNWTNEKRQLESIYESLV